MDPVPRRGRASALNPPNRYDRLHVERTAEDFEDDERRSVEPIFLEWLARNYPHRVDRVVGRLRSLRGGERSDSRFGSRMRGEGPWAFVFSRLFRITTRNLGLNRPYEPLEKGLFRRPGLGGQA